MTDKSGSTVQAHEGLQAHTPWRYRSVAIAALTIVSAVGCDGDTAGPDETSPTFEHVAVTANPNNVLSATVSVRVHDADSAAVRFRIAGAGSALITPAVPVMGDSARIPVLGLVDDGTYVFTPIAYRNGRATAADTIGFRTGSLPLDLPRYSADGPDQSAGYIAFAATPYVVVIDRTGRVVWYQHFPGGTGLNFMAQPNGRYVLRPPTSNPGDIEPWLELDVLGNITRILTCANNLQPRLHDLIALTDGSYWILCDEIRTVDLSAHGLPNARVIGTVVQHIGADHSLRFQWSAFDHFTIGADDLSDRIGGNVNWTHGNAIDLDSDGNLLLSFRNLGEITKINVTTGAVMWRFGGRHNQFALDGTTTPPFARQHGVRRTAPGALVLLDNSGDPTETRAERYSLDAATRTARLTASYRSAPAVITQIGGSVQELPGGRTLVSFGVAGKVEEYDASGQVVWRIQGNAGYVFRAQLIRSLYAPGADGTR